MPRRKSKFDQAAEELGQELASNVVILKGSALRERQEDLIEAAAAKAMEYLPKASHSEMVDTFHETLVNGLHCAMIDAIKEAHRTGDYTNNVLVEAFDKLKEEMDDWTDE